MNIFAALEAINDKTTISDADMTNILLDLASDSDSISEMNAQFAEFSQMDDYIEQSIASVESLITTIEQNGICKSTVMVADPFGEFQSRSILPQVSELNDVPTSDQNSVAAVEGLKEMAKKFWDAIKNFFKKVKDFVVNLFRKFINVFQNFSKIGDKYKKIFDKANNLDEDKLKKYSVPFIDDDMKKLIFDAGSYQKELMEVVPTVAESGFTVVKVVVDGLEGKGDITKADVQNKKDMYMGMIKELKKQIAKGGDEQKLYGAKIEGDTYDDVKVEIDSSIVSINNPSDTSLEKILKTPGEAVTFCKYLISAGLMIKVNEAFSKNYTKASDAVIKVAEKLGGADITTEHKAYADVAKKSLKLILTASKNANNLTIKSCKMLVPVLAKATSCIKD